jgi:hypothetical protein
MTLSWISIFHDSTGSLRKKPVRLQGCIFFDSLIVLHRFVRKDVCRGKACHVSAEFLFSAVFLEKNPFNMFSEPVDVRIHRCGIDSEIMESSFAFCKTFAFDLYLE